MKDAYGINCRWWVALILIGLSNVANLLHKASTKCHVWWFRALFRWGNRDQLQEYHKRYDDVLRVLEGEDITDTRGSQ